MRRATERVVAGSPRLLRAGARSCRHVHSWITLKQRRGAPAYARYEVIGWGVDRGAGVDALIERVEAAVAACPYQGAYQTWPGPKSNTFVAWIERAVPELGLELPPTAIGKDYLLCCAAGLIPVGPPPEVVHEPGWRCPLPVELVVGHVRDLEVLHDCAILEMEVPDVCDLVLGEVRTGRRCRRRRAAPRWNP